MKRHALILLFGALSATVAMANDRSIDIPPKLAMSWEFATHTNQPRARPGLGVGFWQRGSGAAAGAGSNYVATMEYQLPEAAPTRVRKATFQFSGKQSQCTGAEVVVVDVYAYAGDGKGEATDATAGTRVAQLTADCRDNPAFARPIDVTNFVRQMTVASGIRFVGFNVRKGNNRQGPGLFSLAAGRLTVVLADQALAYRPLPSPAATTPAPGFAATRPAGTEPQAAARPTGLLTAFGTMLREAGSKQARDPARSDALDGMAGLPTSSAPAPIGGNANHARQ